MRFEERGGQFLSAALLLCAIVLGGGGLPSGELVVQLLAIALLALHLARPHTRDAGQRAAVIVAGLIVATPLLQSIPLPYSLWRILPASSLADSLLAAAGVTPAARPLSLAPAGARAAGLSLLPAVGMFIATFGAAHQQRRLLVTLVVAGAMASLGLGALQAATGGRFHLASTAHALNATGFFANRNHQATLLLIGMILACGLVSEPARAQPQVHHRLGAALVAAILAIGVLATTSRMGTLLLGIAIPACILLLVPFGRFRWLAGGATLTGIAVVLIAMAFGNAVVGSTFARFTVMEDDRFAIWSNSWAALGGTWPVGSGAGSFVPVFGTAQALETVGIRWVNHAHNDYLEILIEAGVWGLVLMTVGLALIAFRARRAWSQDRLAMAAAIAILIVLLHALVDYPLRMTGLSTVFGLLAGVLFAPPAHRTNRSSFAAHPVPSMDSRG